MIIATLFIMANNWKQPKCSTDKWINKTQCTHTEEYYLMIKGNEVLIRATMWMNLENVK